MPKKLKNNHALENAILSAGKPIPPATRSQYLESLTSFGIKDTAYPEVCNPKQTRDYVLANAFELPKVDRIFYDTNNALNPGAPQPIIYKLATGTRMSLTPQELSESTYKNFQRALAELNKIGIKLKKFSDRKSFEADLASGKYPGKNLIINVVEIDKVSRSRLQQPRQLNSNVNSHGMVGGAASTKYTEVPGLAGKPYSIHIGSMLLITNEKNPISIILHELGHIFGLGHLEQNFNVVNMFCMQPSTEKLNSRMFEHKCVVPIHDCENSSVMFCGSIDSCSNDKVLLSPGDKLAFQEAYQRITGKKVTSRKKIKRKKTKPASSNQRLELMMVCDPKIELCHSFSAVNSTGLRQRHVPALYIETPRYCPDEPLSPAANTPLSNKTISSEYISMRQVSEGAIDSLCSAYALGFANEVIRHLPLNDHDKEALEFIIDFIITYAFYGIPIAALSSGSDLVLRCLEESGYTQTVDRLSVIRPIIPIILNTLYTAYLSQQLYTTVNQCCYLSAELAINIVAGLVGKTVGGISANFWRAMALSAGKYKLD